MHQLHLNRKGSANKYFMQLLRRKVIPLARKLLTILRLSKITPERSTAPHSVHSARGIADFWPVQGTSNLGPTSGVLAIFFELIESSLLRMLGALCAGNVTSGTPGMFSQ